MYMVKTEIPNLKRDLLAQFGYISFQLILANIDVIGIRINKSDELVVILYRGCDKVGFIYEGGTLSDAAVLAVYKDAPEDNNKISQYENLHGSKISILLPPKENYVFATEREVTKIVNPKYKLEKK